MCNIYVCAIYNTIKPFIALKQFGYSSGKCCSTSDFSASTSVFMEAGSSVYKAAIHLGLFCKVIGVRSLVICIEIALAGINI